MSSLPRPTLVIVDGFDLFASHPRQALLYCLLDTVQQCSAGEGKKGVAVVGVTNRVDTLNLLEKRVKSRFSHRLLQFPTPSNLESYTNLATGFLKVPINVTDIDRHQSNDGTELEELVERWRAHWDQTIDTCFKSHSVQTALRETWDFVRQPDLLVNILNIATASLTPLHPYPTPTLLLTSTTSQRNPQAYTYLSDLAFPSLALLVAASHVQGAGHDAFTFEHLFEVYGRASRGSKDGSGGGNVKGPSLDVGLPRMVREIMLGAFENLVATKVFQHSGTTSTSTSFQFVKFRSEVPRADLRSAVEVKGHTQLKRWLTRQT